MVADMAAVSVADMAVADMAVVSVADMAVVSAAAIPTAAADRMWDTVTTEGTASAGAFMAAADTMADTFITARATMAAASVLASMPRPAMDTPRRSAIHRASTTKAAIGIITVVAPLRLTAIERWSLRERPQETGGKEVKESD